MTSSVAADPLSPILELGSPAELRELADDGYAPAQRPRVNTHIHLPPNFSAFDTLPQAVELAAAQDVVVLGVSNYYDYSVYADFVTEAERHRIFPLFGIEIIALIEELVQAGTKINDPGNPGKIYICGKGITRFAEMTPGGRALLDTIRRNDSQRMVEMIARMRQVFGDRGVALAVDEPAVKEMIVRRHGSRAETVYLQERHAAQAFQEALFELVPPDQRPDRLASVFGATTKAGAGDAVAVQNEIRSHLMKAGKPAFVDETFVSFNEAYRLILEMGGIPCYPVLADGASPICPFEEPVEQLIPNIRQRGIWCAEFIPVRNTPEVLQRYAMAMREAGLVLTAGTEHNTLELLPLEPACKGGQSIPEELQEIFWEGACVVAAHQFLTAHGETGFVDNQGRPNAQYAAAEERISAFARLGAAVIRRYHELHGTDGYEGNAGLT